MKRQLKRGWNNVHIQTIVYKNTCSKTPWGMQDKTQYTYAKCTLTNDLSLVGDSTPFTQRLGPLNTPSAAAVAASRFFCLNRSFR